MAQGMMGLGSGLAASSGWMSPMSETFPDPFMDMASLAMPETMQYALRWCEFLFMANGTYRQAIDRVLSYFLTDVEIDSVSDDEREKWSDFLQETIDIRNVLHVVGLDALCYGNSFTSVLPSFRRYLSCNACRQLELPLGEVYNNPTFNFQWIDYSFRATCPRCKQSGEWSRIDRRGGMNSEFRVKRWNPHEIEILWDPYTDSTAYIWKIPDHYRKVIREGRLYHLERADWSVVEAIKSGSHFRIADGALHHMREDALAGVQNRGWGISRVLSNFRQAWYVQVLHRYNEAIALDYVIPFRVITPVPGDKGNGTDPAVNANLGQFMGQVRSMLRRRRRDPAAWHTLPYPIQYQAIGGDAKNLAPKELLDQGQETLLNSIGIPAELYRGTLQIQAAPAALRLFEASWSTLPHNFNTFLRFLVRRVAQLLSWEIPGVRLARVSHADDLQRQQTRLQLMASGLVSPITGLKSVGLEYSDEQDKLMEANKIQAKAQAKLQKEMDQASQMEQMVMLPPGQQPGAPGAPPGAPGAPPGGAPGGAPPAGGAPQGGGAPAGPMGQAAQSVTAQLPTDPNTPVTPEDLWSRADYIAKQLAGMPESQKDSELIKLRKMDPTLHQLVKAKLADIKNQARLQGGNMVMAQQFGKTAARTKPRYSPDGRRRILPD